MPKHPFKPPALRWPQRQSVQQSLAGKPVCQPSLSPPTIRWPEVRPPQGLATSTVQCMDWIGVSKGRPEIIPTQEALAILKKGLVEFAKLPETKGRTICVMCDRNGENLSYGVSSFEKDQKELLAKVPALKTDFSPKDGQFGTACAEIQCLADWKAVTKPKFSLAFSTRTNSYLPACKNCASVMDSHAFKISDLYSELWRFEAIKKVPTTTKPQKPSKK